MNDPANLVDTLGLCESFYYDPEQEAWVCTDTTPTIGPGPGPDPGFGRRADLPIYRFAHSDPVLIPLGLPRREPISLDLTGLLPGGGPGITQSGPNPSNRLDACSNQFDDCTEKAWFEYQKCRGVGAGIGGVLGAVVGFPAGVALEWLGVPIGAELGIVGGAVAGIWGGSVVAGGASACTDPYDSKMKKCWGDKAKCEGSTSNQSRPF